MRVNQVELLHFQVLCCSRGKEEDEGEELFLGMTFKQIKLDPELVKQAKAMVKREYHKDFVVDEDGKWVLQGWKGRILNAFSAWVPA